HPPPHSTLFPYTTLFRSALHTHQLEARDAGDEEVHRDQRSPRVEAARHHGRRTEEGGRECGQEELRARRRIGGARRPGIEDAREDRKSTRLNSSHSQISY